jgi:hypothetical protein
MEVFMVIQDKIEVGDVLDELNGNHITTSKRGKLSSIMRKASGQPIVVNVIKVCILLSLTHVIKVYLLSLVL